MNWFRPNVRQRRFLLSALAGAGVIVVVLQGLRLLRKPQGDFHLHWELGRRVLAGEFIYEGGHDVPYLPFWGLAHAPLTLLPMHAAQLAIFPLFLLALGVLIAVLRKLTDRNLPLSEDLRPWLIAVVLLLCSRFLIRDSSECGVNLALVALTWLSVWQWTRKQDLLAGAALGLAISLKCTPAAFWAYFLWKRQWKLCAVTLVTTVALTLSPILWMGADGYGQALQHWGSHAGRGLSGADPSRGVLGDEKPQNLALRPALARFLMRVPEHHASYVDHPLYFDFLDLPPAAAGAGVRWTMLLLAAAVAWQFRAPVTDRCSLRITWECAAISLAMLLYSPITWGQHCVGVIPAVYLIVRSGLASKRLPRSAVGVLSAYVFFILILNRGIIGRPLSVLHYSYHFHTWCLLGLLLLAVIASKRAEHVAEEAEPHRTDLPDLKEAA